ncbi:ABC transporter substrate-binding protein [Yinghuangia seranimata]|uniref:ABC transporter substrate-binding protein n=1 Tax=Yinghuangia seranimata TaxID=408067 RepID=UPI00248D23D0|nr:ABC transporter substrate-binding protein [Yinghuangia seranimata]MDI2128264.1 ABC transporter substrate-binding protein [Yinghuangia seranimata]
MIQELRAGDPREVGGYRTVARLGAGGMGEVFLGRSASGRLVAVKTVRAELSGDDDFRVRFRREVDASRRVSAFHTAAVVAADADATPAWMVTEYIPGPSLEEAVRAHGAFPVHALRVLGAGLAEALEAIHACGLIHRDLKPSNILLAEDGPRVIDFGIARALEGSTVTRTGFMVGSVGFLSPEQLLADRITPAADVFALGAVLCAAAGLAPFGSGSAQAMLFRVVHQQPELAGLPDELRDIVASCLAKDPAERPRPMDLVHALSEGPAGDWLPPAVLASIAERRSQAQELARATAVGASPDRTEPDLTEPDLTGPGLTGPGLTPPGTTTAADSPASTSSWRNRVSGFPDAVPAPVPPPPPSTTPPPWPHDASGYPDAVPVPPPPSSVPHSLPPLHLYPPPAPPARRRLDRLPGGSRVWVPLIVVTALGVLAGLGTLTALLVNKDKGGQAENSSGPNTPALPPQRGGTVTVSINADSTSLDPAGVSYRPFGDGQRMSALYDPLVVFTPSTGKVTPFLAKGLTSSPDGFTWTLELRPGVRFSDGSTLDADAVKFNWDRFADPAVKSVHAGAVRGLTTRVVDPTHLSITLPYPDLTFDHLLASDLSYVASPTAVRKDPSGFGANPVGAGPFKLQSWERGRKQTFVRNTDYWRGPDKPYLDTLVFAVDSDQPVAPVIARTADLNFQSANRDVAQARSAGLELRPTTEPGGIMMTFNAGRAPFDDPRARKAVALALDADALARSAQSGVTVSTSVVPSDSPVSEGLPQQPAKDATEAQRLLDQLAAEGKPLAFTVVCGANEQSTMEAAKAQLARYRNVTMTVQVSQQYDQLMATRQYDAIWTYATGPDITTWLYTQTRGGVSPSGYQDAAVDAAWTAVRSATSDQARKTAYATLLAALNNDPPWWVYGRISLNAVHVKDALTGLDSAYADGILQWADVARAKP